MIITYKIGGCTFVEQRTYYMYRGDSTGEKDLLMSTSDERAWWGQITLADIEERKKREQSGIEEMKCCPFCGGAPNVIDHFHSIPESGDGYTEVRTECPACGISTSYNCEEIEEAARIWNTRVRPNPEPPVTDKEKRQ